MYLPLVEAIAVVKKSEVYDRSSSELTDATGWLCCAAATQLPITLIICSALLLSVQASRPISLILLVESELHDQCSMIHLRLHDLTILLSRFSSAIPMPPHSS
jgi:hypothetical protein